MLPLSIGREASPSVGASHYARHRPERTLLYQLVQEYYPAFVSHLAAQGAVLPDYVQQEFADYLNCGRLELGFLRLRCDTCHAEHLLAFSCKRRGLLRASCPSPFGPAFGCSKSLPAILSVRAVVRGAGSRARPYGWTKCCRTNRCASGC